MNSMRAAILSNPTLAETIHQNQLKREQAEQRKRARQAVKRAAIARDAAIAALLKARKSKKKSRPLLTQLLETVDNLRTALQSTRQTA